LNSSPCISGSSIAAHSLLPNLPIFAAEPEGAADAYESVRRGERVTDIVPRTICDGLRAAINAYYSEPVSPDSRKDAKREARLRRILAGLNSPSAVTR